MKNSEDSELIARAREKVASLKQEELKGAGFVPMDGRYFPAIYYPPITMYPDTDQDTMLRGLGFDPSNRTSLYFHIPFCPRRCAYCHWVVSVGNSADDMDRYLTYIEKESRLYREILGTVIAPTSILIGGGTPSMLPPGHLERFMRFLHSDYDLANCSQITIEIEPTTVLGSQGQEKLKVMKQHGINRISLGVQSFDDGILKRTGRGHTAEGAREAIRQMRRAGFDNISLDLIYGYPGSNFKNWIETLRTAHALGIDAYQLYRLRIVPHGAKKGMITTMYEQSPQDFPTVEEIYVMKELGILVSAELGFTERSRRVFCNRPEHNSDYLQDHTDRLSNVLGLGISSWTNLQCRFYINTGKDLADYYSCLDKGKIPITRGKLKTDDDKRRWAICLSLKHNGVSKDFFAKVTGSSLEHEFGLKITRLIQYGLVEDRDGMLKLTERGRFFADEVVIQFYHPDYMPFPRTAYADGVLNPYHS